MSFLDTLKKWLNNNKNTFVTQIIATDIHKIKGSSDELQFALYDHKNQPLPEKECVFTFHFTSGDVDYTRTTNNEGIVSLPVNLNPGVYSCTCKFNGDRKYRASTKNVKIYINPVLHVQDMSCTEKAGQPLKVLVTDANGMKIDNQKCTFTFHFTSGDKDYVVSSRNDGVASIPINLMKGKYNVTVKCHETSENVTVTCISKPKKEAFLKGTNIDKKQGTPGNYTFKLYTYDKNKKIVNITGKKVYITIAGKTYIRTTNTDGNEKLAINLNKGKYTIKTVFKGDDDYLPCTRTNQVIIHEPVRKVYNACIFYEQNNNVNCGPASLEICSQILGNHISQNTFADVCNTGSNGTAPSDLMAGAKKEGFKLTRIPLTFKAVTEAIESGKPVIYHHWTGGLNCMSWVNGYGHYAVIYEWSDNPNRFYCCDPTKGFAVCSPSAIISASYNFYTIERI